MAERKRRKRIRRKKNTSSFLRLGVLITILVFIVVAAGVLMAPFFDVAEVYCEGNVNVKTEDIITSAQIENGKHILLIKLNKAEKRIEDIPLVKEASVRRVFPNKICVNVTERTPAAYVMRGGECVAFDTEGIVLEVISDSTASAIEKELTPKEVVKKVEDKDSKNTKDKNSKKDTEDKESAEETDDTTDTESTENTENAENAENTKNSEESKNSEDAAADKLFNVPLVGGIEISGAEHGKTIKPADKEKFDELMRVLGALDSAGLLERATYVNVENIADIRIIIEKRLDIYIGGTDNIDYRAKFLAEVINNKISAYENVVMDYRGDDIFVRPPDDGKERMKVKDTKSKDDKETSESSNKSDDSDDSDESENSDGTNNKKSKTNSSEVDDDADTEDDDEISGNDMTIE